MSQPIEAGLRAFLAAQAALRNLLGDESAGETFRFHPDELPEKPTLPAVAYQLVSAPRFYAQDDGPGAGTPAIRSRIQLTILAHTRAECRTVAAHIEAPMGGYSGALGATSGTCFVENVIDGFDPATDLRATTMDVLILHDQFVPV